MNVGEQQHAHGRTLARTTDKIADLATVRPYPRRMTVQVTGFDHLVLRVSDVERSLAFYKAALAPLGYEVLMQFPGVAGLGEEKKPDLWLGGGGAGHKMHVAIRAKTRAQVDAFYASAIAAGGKDNGGPGVRANYHPNYYGAFVFDPDGHNLEAVCHTPE